VRTLRRAIALASIGAVLCMPAAAAQPSAPMYARDVVQHAAAGQRLRTVGDVTLCRSFSCEQAASLALEVAPASWWWLSGEGTVGRRLLSAESGPRNDRRIDLVVGRPNWRAWIGRGAAEQRLADTAGWTHARWAELGGALQWRSIAASVSIGAGSATLPGQGSFSTNMRVIRTLDSLSGAWRTDTVRETVRDSAAAIRSPWSSTEVRLAWRADRWSAGAVIGRLASRPGGATLWAGMEGTRRIHHDMAIAASAGTRPRQLAAAGQSPRWVMSLGLTAVTAWLSTDAHAGADPEAAAEPFATTPLGDRRYRVVVRLANVARAELASDCTAWRPIPMRRLHGDLWAADLVAEPGAHRVSLRLDGGAWSAPPGLTEVSDDFGGSAGVFVIR
jgi:hypothetical protein